MKNSFSSASRGLVVAAAIVIIIAGMKQAAPLLVPFLLSVFIAVLSLPALNALEKRGLGQGMSLLLVMLAVLVIGALLAMLVGSSIDDFSAAMPEYQLRISAQKTQFIDLAHQSRHYRSFRAKQQQFRPECRDAAGGVDFRGFRQGADQLVSDPADGDFHPAGSG